MCSINNLYDAAFAMNQLAIYNILLSRKTTDVVINNETNTYIHNTYNTYDIDYDPKKGKFIDKKA